MEKKQYVYVKFPTNIAETVTFNFDSGIEKEGQYGKYYNWGVKWEVVGDDGKKKNVEAYMSATPMLNDMLLKVGNLYGKTLQILKYEDGNKKAWKILDMEGNTIEGDTKPSETPENPVATKSTPNMPIPQEVAKLLEAMEAMRAWAITVNTEIKTLKEKVGGLETLSVDIHGKDAVDLHTSFLTESPLGAEYNDIPKIN